MQARSLLQRCAYAAVVSATLMGIGAPAKAQGLPAYMQPIEGRTTTSAADIANKNVLALNTMMFELYGDAAGNLQRNLLSKHPVILGLFSGAGGRFILYRPNMPPLEAPQVPIVYQLLKSVGHSTMAVSEVVLPFVDNPADLSWRSSMLAYRSRMQSALDGLDATPIQPEWRDTVRTILQNNIAFMDDCVAKGVIAFAKLEEFGKKQSPNLARIVSWAAQTQVKHWMAVIADWKKMLGSDWEKTYAASNTIYVARQNNILFSVLAQFFGPAAINDRLMLIETISFTTTPGDMIGIAHPHHRRPFGRGAVFRQLPPDGLRADGRGRARDDHRRSAEIRNAAVPASGRAVRLEAMADPDHAGSGSGLACRLEVRRQGSRSAQLGGSPSGEVGGIASAFSLANARQAVASVWKSPDRPCRAISAG